MLCSLLFALGSSLLLAQAASTSTPEPTSWLSMGWVIAAIFGIVGLANQGMALWDRLFPRAMPPAHEVYATKAELQTAKVEHQASDARIERRFEEWMEQQQEQHKENLNKLEDAMQAFQQWQQTIERALGHVETKADVALGKATRK